LAIARMAGFERILTFDMGGTSTDVALVTTQTGLRTTSESQIAGMPVAVPMLDIHTVGAGGGSIARFDRGGGLHVGPESAGAEPGPICYGRGEEPTVTDANLLLGRLDTVGLLGGAMKLDESRARAYFERAKGGLATLESFAEGIVRVADSHMEKALRRISIEQGRDPRDFVLLSFGGAGPLHACALARALSIPKVLAPRHPGALSAYGILVSDVVRDYSRTVMLKPEDERLSQHLKELEEIGRKEIGGEGAAAGAAAAARSVDMRYAGQGYELNVDWAGDFVGAFHRLHEQRYGYSDERREVQVVNARVRMIAATEQKAPERHRSRAGNGEQAVIREKPIYFDGRWVTGCVYQRERLKSGEQFSGPAVVVEYSATTFIPPGAAVELDEFENMIIAV
jgi:N-methylhydantoinase A